MPKLRVITKMPPEPHGEPEQQVAQLRDYLLQLCEELAYVLTHLEADNINDSTFERIQGMIPRPYTGLPVMDGDASSGQSEQWARGDHRHGHDSSKADVTALEAEAAAREAHEDDTGNPHEVTKSQVGLGNVANERQYSAQNPPPTPTPGEVGAIPVTEKGSAGGVAELDSNGMVPSAQLPSYVDDVLEYASLSVFPVTGESGKIYVALDTNRTYRWSGSAYVEISESLALGETSSTAYRGDRGKTAYDHSQVTSGNPHQVTAAEVGLGNVDNVQQYSALNPPPLPTPADIGAAEAQDLTDHVNDTANPHGVTAAQVGLGNVDNVQQYSASNPPPYPVTSVNGSTGAVTLDASDVGARANDWVPSASDVGVIPNPAGSPTNTLTKLEIDSKVYEITGGGGGGPDPATQTPAMDGTGAVGISLKYAREDHEHPADTGKQDAITASGILKGDGAGGVSAATAGTDYQTPLTAGTDYATPGMIPSVPIPSDSTPQNLGTAAAGISSAYSRADHIHQKPTYSKADVGLGNVENERQYSSNNPPPYPVTYISVTFNCDSSGRHTFSNGELPNRALSSPVGCLAKDASNNYLNAGTFDINPRYTTAGTFVSSSCANKEVTLFFAVYN